MGIISINKFKTYKYDAAPFFFFIDVFPADTSDLKHAHYVELINSIKYNPIMPLPMRVDRVYNAENSIVIRPREPTSVMIREDLIATINPIPFLQLGIEKLVYFTEVIAREKFYKSLSIEHARKWWKSTRYLYGNLSQLEEDFLAILRAYLNTVVKAKLDEGDLAKAAIEYCQIIIDLCNKRIDENSFLVEIRGKERNVLLFRVKEVEFRRKGEKLKQTQYHPELLDIEVFNLRERDFPTNKDKQNNLLNELRPKVKKYIPLLFYDDLLECMLQNTADLEEDAEELLDPSFLIDQNIIIIQESKGLQKSDAEIYSWWSDFEDIKLESIFEAIKATYKEYYLSLSKQKPL
ncbi:MAG: hypothetical protein ACFE8L_11105 [Candidatus Hodarchaeota archaeon]